MILDAQMKRAAKAEAFAALLTDRFGGSAKPPGALASTEGKDASANEMQLPPEQAPRV